MKKLHLLLITTLLAQFSLFASSPLLHNRGIIDIGHKQESSEIEVPKEKIFREPSMQITDNRLTYQKRIQSELFDCETDFLGTETCSQQQSVCPSNEEYVDGYSVLNHVLKTAVQLCQIGLLNRDGKCYLDENGDMVADDKEVTYTIITELPTRQLSSGDYSYCNKYGTFIDTGKSTCTGSNWYRSVAILDCVGTTYRDYSNSIIKSCSPSGEESECFGGDGHDWGGHAVRPNGCPKIREDVIIETQCPAGYQIDGKFCYKDSFCGFGYTEQSDGSCKMEYDWYSYLCPADINIYNGAWQPIESGSDCGNPSCTNSATPPANNCVRLNYTCPTNPNEKCGKTLNTIGTCNTGYVWNTNRCERIESFCGSSFYNATLDVCQDVTRYEKLCGNSNETYNRLTDLCETGLQACLDGEYESDTNMCTLDYRAECLTLGYVYNNVSGVCEDSDAAICEPQYNYNGDFMCVGEMTACATNLTYNETTMKCEQIVCDILNTTDSGIQCETEAPCVGTIIDNKCIPDTVQQ